MIRSQFILGHFIVTYLILFSSLTSVSAQEESLISSARTQLPTAFENEEIANRLYYKIEPVKDKKGILLGYWGALNFAQSVHVNIFRKMTYFNRGKKYLEQSLKQESENVELHFLRLTIQANLPSFLNYSDDIEKDKQFLLNNIQRANETLQQKILNFVLEQEVFTAVEKEAFRSKLE